MSEQPAPYWCAIYTRKSTDEGLDSDFSSLDAQRESCEAFIASRKAEGWCAYPEPFDDPAYSAGNTDRPALQRLLTLVKQEKIQAIVSYKYDRLSRNLSDFVKLLDLFDRHGVAFVSVTQQFDTSTSIGRVFQAMLMGFSQFERELVVERVKDKRTAMIRKGKWPGGMPIIGYDVDYERHKLLVNRQEAKQARLQFEYYLQEQSLGRTARRLNAEGYRLKQWTTKAGHPRGGGRYAKTNLTGLLQNPLYVGMLRLGDELVEGEHTPVIEEPLFHRVQKLLAKNFQSHTSENQVKHVFLLKGLVRCAACQSQMTTNFAYSRGKKYFYYKCTAVDKSGTAACPVRSVPAKALEALVIQRLAFLGEQQALVEDIVQAAQDASVEQRPRLRQEQQRLTTEGRKIQREADRLVATLGQGEDGTKNRFMLERLDALDATRRELEEQQARLEVQLQQADARALDADIIRRNLAQFTEVITHLTPTEQKDLLKLLLQEVLYDQNESLIKLTLRPLPELKCSVEDDKVSFDERCEWLPWLSEFSNCFLRENVLETNVHYQDLRHLLAVAA